MAKKQLTARENKRKRSHLAASTTQDDFPNEDFENFARENSFLRTTLLHICPHPLLMLQTCPSINRLSNAKESHSKAFQKEFRVFNFNKAFTKQFSLNHVAPGDHENKKQKTTTSTATTLFQLILDSVFHGEKDIFLQTLQQAFDENEKNPDSFFFSKQFLLGSHNKLPYSIQFYVDQGYIACVFELESSEEVYNNTNTSENNSNQHPNTIDSLALSPLQEENESLTQQLSQLCEKVFYSQELHKHLGIGGTI
jgi:hypothetical protein